MGTIGNDLLHLFFPPVCLGCGTLLVDGERVFCLSCLGGLPRTGECPEAHNRTAQLFTGYVRIEYAFSFLEYVNEGSTQKLVHSLKYHELPKYGYWMGRQAALELQERGSRICAADVLLPVPLHPRKKRQRGYNQSEWIARGIQSVWGTPVDTQSLRRTVYTETQTRRSDSERRENMQNVFHLARREAVRGKHILLIDDVITTGSTLINCAKALLQEEGTRVSIFALTRARK